MAASPDLAAFAPETRRRRRSRVVRPTKPSAAEARRFSRAVRAFAREITATAERELAKVLRETEGEYLRDGFVRDAFADDIERIFDGLRVLMAARVPRARRIASTYVSRTNQRHRSQFVDRIQSAIGIDVAALVTDLGLGPLLQVKTRENVQLITSIPAQYLDRVETMVLERAIQGRTSAKSMIAELRDIGAKTDRRARLIARDQTAKLNAALNRARNERLGIEEYIWSTSKDERVRENHASKEGKRFRWDDPPADTGHPGEDFQCRCSPLPVIEF